MTQEEYKPIFYNPAEGIIKKHLEEDEKWRLDQIKKVKQILNYQPLILKTMNESASMLERVPEQVQAIPVLCGLNTKLFQQTKRLADVRNRLITALGRLSENTRKVSEEPPIGEKHITGYRDITDWNAVILDELEYAILELEEII